MPVRFVESREAALENDMMGFAKQYSDQLVKKQENERQNALLGFQAGEELRKQGYDVKPEEYKTLADAYQKGDTSALSSVFGGIQQRGYRPEIQKIKDRETDKFNLEKQASELGLKKTQAEIDDLNRPYPESKAGRKFTYEEGVKQQGASGKAFGEAVAKKEAERFADSQTNIPRIGQNISKIDEAIKAQLDYKANSFGGTGALATVGGVKKYLSQDLEKLEAKFRDINLKNMVTTFSGMSKAVDSDAERRAWESTQPGIRLDDKTNLSIMVGQKSSLLKDKAVADAQNDWVKQNGGLRGFEQNNPILNGLVTTVVDRNGNMQLVPKESLKQYLQQGYMTNDDYVEMISGDKKSMSRQEKIEALRAKGF